MSPRHDELYAVDLQELLKLIESNEAGARILYRGGFHRAEEEDGMVATIRAMREDQTAEDWRAVVVTDLYYTTQAVRLEAAR